ncbi:hypothetical protein M3Y94_00649700 [Aphelenchoides besseyi]|nr:hypothetical protein M3Y94_00649700 [Aphelenchoides besseyi]KAI6231108.1 Uridine nucleosidase 1 [Aphelenchoides besseyi]
MAKLPVTLTWHTVVVCLVVALIQLFLGDQTAAEEQKLVIDTDGVVDDVKAISLALQNPKVNVVAITTVAGSTTVEQATANVARTLRANGVRKYIPVIKGAEFALIGNINTTQDGILFFGQDGLSNQPHSMPRALDSDSTAHVKGVEAAEALVELFKRNRGKLTLIALGPLTNLAMAIKIDPEFALWPKKLVLTGGNFYGMGNIRTSSTAEFNFNADPEAAEIVLQSMKCPITIVAWETTFFYQDIQQKRFDFKRHISLDFPLARYFKAISQRPRQFMSKFNLPYRYCDEITVAAAIEPTKIIDTSRNISAAVELHGTMTRGQLVIAWLEDYFGKSMETQMNKIELVMNYNFEQLDEMMIDAIQNVQQFDQFI